MLGANQGRWAFEEIGPALGKKYELAKRAADAGGEFLGRSDHYFDDKIVCHEIGFSTPSRWSNAKNGNTRKDSHGRSFTDGYVRIDHLQKLAAYLELNAPRYWGAEAWRYFTPEFSEAEFEAALCRVGYGHLGFMRGYAVRPADGLLAWFARYGLTSLGIEICRGREFHRNEQERERAGALDEMEEAVESTAIRFAPGDDVVLRVAPPRPAHVLLLEISDASHAPGFRMRCLAPSYRHQVSSILADGSLPSSADTQGRRGFKLGEERGRIDFVAVVTRGEPLSLPFSPILDRRYYVIEPMDELRILKDLIASRMLDISILHAPIRIW